MLSSQDIVRKLDLNPHPEGGYFRETYRSGDVLPEDVLDKNIQGSRNTSTGIYYLLESGDFSAFHKINQDEMWHFYLGDAIELSMISEHGKLSTVIIGSDILKGELLQFIVPKNYWFGARILKENSFALLGCTVAPGFDFKDFTLGNRYDLIKQFSEHKNIITALTRA